MCGLGDANTYRTTLKDFASNIAGKRQSRFKLAALAMVGAHVIATALALLAIKTHGETALFWLLGIELSFLAAGLAYHEWLHRSHATQQWALARLSAEVTRSVIPLAGVRLALRHLFDLPMPHSLRPLLRTLNVLHLAGLRSVKDAWQTRRQTYVEVRLRKPKSGQIDYYAMQLTKAERRLKIARWTFYLGSAGAFLATSATLALQTEARLLGETANWYARRAFTGVA